MKMRSLDSLLTKFMLSMACLFQSAVTLYAAPFTAGNIAVLQAESSSANNTTASIIELSPSTAAQTPSNVIAIDGTGTNALRISGSASTTGFLATSADGTRLALMGANNTNTSSNVNTLNPRGVGVLDAWGNFTLPTTYTGTSGNQTRCATTLDNSTWWIADQGGIYSNGTTTASPSGNMRTIKAFGGTVYVSRASSASTDVQVSTLSAATGGTLTGLSGLTNNNNLSDFYIISSGENGAAFDVLYVVTSSSIAKFSKVRVGENDTWTANGTYTGLGGFAIAARDSGTGADLFISTGGGALSANSVVRLTDAAGHNATINITTASNVTLYTAPSGRTVKGVAFAPAPPQVILTEINSNAAGGDFWELTNVGPTSVDLGNWKWLDGGQTSLPAPAVQVFPEGTTLASGETMVIITDTTNPTTFLNAWGPLTGIQRLVGGPGLGMNDSVKLYDQNDNLVFNFTYAAGGFTQSSGSPAAGGHAGASAGGVAAQSAVIDPAFGTGLAKRYRAATVGVDGGYANTSGGSNIGSPGVTGINFGGGPSITLTLGVVPATFSESATNPAATGTVTRTGSTTAELVVTLSSSDTTEATVPASVTIAAGQASATFNVTAVDDSFPDGPQNVTITASATGATPATFEITVQDDGDVVQNNLMLTEVQSQQAASRVNDYWELTNFGSSAVSLAGYSWHDSGRSASAAAAYKLPAGSSIAPGESVIFTTITPAAFRAWWGVSSSVQVFQTVGAPGLGQGDGVALYDDGGNELFYFSYAAGGGKKADGTDSTGGHAGRSAGGSADSQAAVWVPSSGTTSPRYTFAVTGQLGCFSSVANTADIGSPGVTAGLPTVDIASASVLEGNSSSTTLTLNVTRSDTSTAFTVNYAVTDGTATSGTDYTALTPGTLTFTAGGPATLPINISVLGDTLSEPDETILVTLSSLVNSVGTTVIGTATGTGTILNDDTLGPVITTEPADSTIASGYTATLSLAATGTPAPTVQWYRGNAGDTSNPVGTGGASFTTPALTATTSYWARASNSGGNADTRTATVTVTTGPVAVDLSTYVRVGRYNLPEYRRTPLPNGTASHNLLCDEASAVAYNWDTDTLFITGDGGRSITQVTKSGQLVDTMSLELNSGKPQGVEFYDPEGITYIGNGEFVFSEERERRLVKFTYAAGTTLTRAAAQTVKIGTFDDNTGTEGLSWDPQTSGYIVLKEKSPIGVFQTGVDFAAGTATNGSPTTVNSVNLFNTALLGMTDVADVFALSNLPSMSGQPQAGNLLILGQEDARVVNISRSGVIHSTLQITSDSGNPLSAADQQHEGITMDRAGVIYIVNENGGGSIEFPQLWVYAPSTQPNQPPTALALNNAVNSIEENTSTASPIKLGDIVVTDDGLGVNVLGITGPDAASFQITGTALFLKAGVVLDYETKTSYTITLTVDDTSVGATPDATLPYTLSVTDQLVEAPPKPALIITEVAPWASGNGAVGGDWFEVTNVSANAVDITGWKMDDNSNSFASSVALSGITSIAPGESVIFIESTVSNQATIVNTFKTVWFGSNVPSGLQIGTYQGSGVGLGTGGDAVNLYTAAGILHSRVTFGASDSVSPYQTFDNTAALNDVTLTLFSQVGVNGAFVAATSAVEIGSPGYSAPGVLRITEVSPWSSGNSPVAADWFEVTNVGARAVDITGWKVDDSSESPAAAVPMSGITSIAPGESVIFLESANLTAVRASFLSNWFGSNPPASLQVGAYSGDGVGLSTSGDAVNLYDTNNVRRASVSFGTAPSSAPFRTFENAAAADVVLLTTLSTVGVNGAFTAVNSATEVGSPGVAFVSIPVVDPVEVVFAAPVFTFSQGQAVAAITLTRSGSAPASVKLVMQDGAVSSVPPFAPARAGVDYTSFNGQPAEVIHFAENETNRTVLIPLLPNLLANQSNKRFNLSLTDPANGTSIGLQGSATVQIIANDLTPPSLIVTSPAAHVSTLGVTLPFTVKGVVGDSCGIQRVEVSLNGSPPMQANLESATSSNSIPFTLPVSLVEGMANTLQVRVYNLAGLSRTVTRTFTLHRRYQVAVNRTAPAGTSLSEAGTLGISVTPAGRATPLSLPDLTGSQTTDVQPGAIVRIQANPKIGYVLSHWSGLPANALENRNFVTFVMPEADVPAILVHFVANPFVGPTGSGNQFYGLIQAQAGTTPANDTEGFMVGTLDPIRGSFTGRLTMAGGSMSFVSFFHGDGSSQFNLLGHKQPSLTLGGRVLTMTLNAGQITAQLSLPGGGSSGGILRRASHSATHKVPAAMLNEQFSSRSAVRRGFYTLALPAKPQSPGLALTSYPQGDGYGTLLISEKGMVTLSGTLADGTNFTASTALVAGQQSPVFCQITTPGASATNKGGSLSGTFTFDVTAADSDVTGADLLWFRPSVTQRSGTTSAAKATQIYTEGWPHGIRVDSVGALYDRSLDVQTALGLGVLNPALGNADLLFTQGGLSADLQITGFNITPGPGAGSSQVSKVIPSDLSYTLTTTQKLGTFNGSFTPDWMPKALLKPTYRGVLLQKGGSRGGYGFFISNRPGDLDPESGRVTLGTP